MFGRRLADDAHMAWKYGSIRFMALGAVCQTTVIACPPQIAQYIPPWIFQALSEFSLFCIFAAGVSRITVAKDQPDVQHTDPANLGR